MTKLISLCMIVKNEEKVLGRCLESAKDLVDEIIVVDTGSTDRTKEIALQYTDKVIDFEWVHDFAVARNESLRHATGQWILVLDADEYIQPGQRQALVEMLGPISVKEPVCYSIRMINFLGDGNGGILESPAARLFSNRSGLYFSEPIHEQLTATKGRITFLNSDFVVYHTGYTEETAKEKQKNKRNLDILEKLRKSKKGIDPYLCFSLANEYLHMGDDDKAIEHYRLSYQYAKSNALDWYPHMLERLIRTLMRKKQFTEALRYINKGKNTWPNHSDFHCLEGLLFETFGFYNKATQSFEKCIQIADRGERLQSPYWLTQGSYGQEIPHRMLADITRKQGNLNELVHHLTAMLQSNRNQFAVLGSLLRTLAAHESTSNVRIFIEKLYPLTEPKNAFILFQVCLSEGLNGLTTAYKEECDRLQVPVAVSDQLRYSLLHKGSLVTASIAEPLPSQVALFSSIATGDKQFIALAESDSGLLEAIYNKLTAEADEPQAVMLLPEEYPFMVNLLIQLLRYDYLAEYDRIVQRFADVQLIQSLADQLSNLGYMELAIDLYGLLLDNGQLHGYGCRQMGMYCYRLGNLEDGLMFMEQALQIDPSMELLGLVVENRMNVDIDKFVADYRNWMPDCPVTI